MREVTRSRAAWKGSTERIWEPMWTLTPAASERLFAGGLAVDGAGETDGDAELVFAEAGGDVGVGLGEDVGVDAEGEAGALAEEGGAVGEQVELGLGLDVEDEDVGFEGGVDLGDLLADAGEDDLLEGRLPGLADALELAAGDDVEARAAAVRAGCSRASELFAFTE